MNFRLAVQFIIELVSFASELFALATSRLPEVMPPNETEHSFKTVRKSFAGMVAPVTEDFPVGLDRLLGFSPAANEFIPVAAVGG